MNKKSNVLALALAASLAVCATSMATPPPTDAAVGDAGSFGSKAIWLGVVFTGQVTLAADCTGVPLGPDDRCVPIAPVGPTPFYFPDLGRITLPANSTNTFICHWATPNGGYTYFNGTAAPATAQISVQPIYRLESKVLQGPPWNGGIDTVVSGYRDLDTVAAGATTVRQVTASRVCITGLITKTMLINDYGLTAQQAAAFFQNPITILAGIAGSVSGKVTDAFIVYNTRFTGDHP